MKTIGSRRLALLWLVGLIAAPSSHAADSAFADIQRVLDAGVVRVAMLNRDVAPMIMTAEDGTPSGAEAGLARDLAAKLGVEVAFLRSAETYDAVVDQIAAKQADLGISFLSAGVDRALRVHFSRPYIRQSGRLFYNRIALARLKRDYGIEQPRDIDAIAGSDAVIFGVVEGSIYQRVLERDFSQFQIQHYANLDDLMQAVRSDEIFGGVHGGLQIEFFMRLHPSTAIHVAVDTEHQLPSDISIAVRPDAPNLLRWVDIYLAANVGLKEADEIVEHYVEALAEEGAD